MVRYLGWIGLAVALAGCGAEAETEGGAGGSAGGANGGSGGAGSGGNEGGSGGSEVPDLPAGVTSIEATTGHSDRVELRWTLGEGRRPTALVVYRDGVEIAELEGTATSFRDEAASPPTVGEVRIDAEGRPGRVSFEWDLPLTQGQDHVYTVETPEAGVSPEATGRRSALSIQGISFSRGDDEPRRLDAGTSRHVEQVPGGSVEPPILVVEPSRTFLQLRWEEPKTEAPEAATYQVEFELSDGSRKSGSIEARPGAPEITGYVIYRDGEELDRPGATVTSSQDHTAGPGSLEALSLTALPSSDAVTLSWQAPVVKPGQTHTYRVEAVATGDLRASSQDVASSRLPPQVDGVELRRDGARIATLGASGPGSFRDQGAVSGTVGMGPLSVAAAAGSVGLSWGDPTPSAGRQHAYTLHALSQGEPILSSAPVTSGRQAPGISSFTILRDGVEVASVPMEGRSWDDPGATPPALGAPFLLANHRVRTDGVLLRWAEGFNLPTLHDYEIRVDTTVGPGGRATARGGRVADAVAFEFQRDGGDWHPLDAQPGDEEGFLQFLDSGSPLGTIAMTATVTTHPVLWHVGFNVSQPVIAAPQATAYRVRAVSEGVVGAPSDVATAGRSVGTGPRYQWQRSAGTVNADYVDLAHTSTSGYDDETFDSPRWYRVRVTVPGAEGYSNAVPSTPDTFVDLAASTQFTCGIRASDGKRRCWGSNLQGQAPAQASLDSFDQIAVGESFGCGIRSDDGKVVCWGNNVQGQAPAGPSAVSYRKIDAGHSFACGIRADGGRIDCWGNLSQGQAPPASVTDAFDDLALGDAHVCAIRSADRKVLCWGPNTRGEAPAGPSADAYLQIDAGRQHTCGVGTDHLVRCWGNNLYGESTPPVPTTPMERVDLGHRHSCGIRQTDGKVICWGGVPEFNPAFMAWTTHAYEKVAGGFDHSCAIRREDGRVTCIGVNSSQQAPQPFAP